ncbi:MAG: tetratricopeptide repeat protein [Acidobacteria bacterium]|nr:tetratricopeptide repeat protein [Acidobacteriota bacterium]
MAVLRFLQILSKIVLSLGLGYCAYLVALRGIADWHFRYQPAPEGIRKAMEWAQANPEYSAALARSLQRSVGEGNPEETVKLYEKATQLGPSRAGYWVELGDAYELSGQEAQAERAYERAQRLFPQSPEINWRLGNFYIRTGKIAEALPALQKAMVGDPGMRLPAFDLAWRAGADPQLILQVLLPPQPEAFFQYIDYLLWAGHLDEAGQAWDRLAALGISFETSTAFSYLDALIQNQRVDKLEAVWQVLLERNPAQIRQRLNDQSRIINGEFEGEILNGGLEWRISPAAGALVTVDTLIFFDGTRSLRIRFDGKQNLDYNHVFQYVPVKPNTSFQFLGYMRTEKITTDSGPHFEIQDAYDRSKLFLATENLRGTSSWTPQRLQFRTGPDTRLLIIRVARQPSRKFDNQIAGTVWIDRLSLLPTG